MNRVDNYSLQLIGRREFHIAEDIADKVDDIVEEMVQDIPASDRTEPAIAVRWLVTEELKGKEISREITHMRKREITRTDAIPSFIFERDEKRLTSAEERNQWQPRIAMIDKVFSESSIFSLSIIPFNPDEEQTWFYKKMRKNAEFEATYFSFYRDQTTRGPADPNNPPELVKWFFFPFPGFSSLVQPEFTPQEPPPSARRAQVVYLEDADPQIACINDENVRHSLRTIVASFIDDTHTKEIALVILQAPRPELLFFSKKISQHNT